MGTSFSSKRKITIFFKKLYVTKSFDYCIGHAEYTFVIGIDGDRMTSACVSQSYTSAIYKRIQWNHMMWSWVQPGMLYWMKCHLFHDTSRWENYCADAREGKRPSIAVCSLPCDLIQCACLVEPICACTDRETSGSLGFTDQLSSTWTVTWTCRKKKVCCTWLHSLGDVTVTTYYANLAQLPTGYSCCNVTSNYSVSLQYEVWIVVCVCSHVLYTWLSTKIFLLAFSLLHCIKRILFYSLRIRTIPFVKCLLLSALLHLWYNWSFLNSQLSIYLSAL